MTGSALQPATLFEQVLGDGFERVVGPARELHRVRGRARYTGRSSVVRGTHVVSRVLASITRLPPAMHDAPIEVEFTTGAGSETWLRSFNGHRMQSRLHVQDGRLREWLGPVRFTFDLRVDGKGAVLWRVARVHVLGAVPLPPHWFAAVRCREGADGDRYTFEIDAALPVIGMVVRYAGWLQRG